MTSNYEIFEKYLSGELKGAELDEFRKKLSLDAGLEKELELFRQVRLGISQKFWNEEEEKALSGNLGKLGKEFFAQEDKPGAKVVSMTHRIWLATAAIAAGILLLIFVWQPWQQSLYDQFASHPVAELRERSSDSGLIIEMEQAYNEGHYEKAIELFDQFLSENPNDSEIIFLKGISLLELDELEKARAIFEEISLGDSVFKDQGTWYLALSYLKTKDYAKCKEYLELIPKSSVHFGSSERILKKLK